MTDVEVMRAMLTRAGVVFTEEVCERDDAIVISHRSKLELELGGPLICVTQDYHKLRNVGYMGFQSTFYFRPDGSLQAVGAWE